MFLSKIIDLSKTLLRDSLFEFYWHLLSNTKVEIVFCFNFVFFEKTLKEFLVDIHDEINVIHGFLQSFEFFCLGNTNGLKFQWTNLLKICLSAGFTL